MNPRIASILVPTDFSQLSVEALRLAASIAEKYESEIVLLNVIDDAPVLAFHTMELTSDVAMADTSDIVLRQLQEFVRMHDIFVGKGIRCATRRGNPHEEIIRYAAEEHADLIVMATHGRTGVAHVLLGSVAEKVVQHARVPVMTVKPAAIHEHAADDLSPT